jgi:hypothetical protein
MLMIVEPPADRASADATGCNKTCRALRERVRGTMRHAMITTPASPPTFPVEREQRFKQLRLFPRRRDMALQQAQAGLGLFGLERHQRQACDLWLERGLRRHQPSDPAAALAALDAIYVTAHRDASAKRHGAPLDGNGRTRP